ncbi:MAG: hypothetical protein DHS20C11_00870 [Lysobacteraceae bacterium]|nr:MAG: hypothetical protein DHS20C11_00870 [Xanthomonadaceae bacterium]
MATTIPGPHPSVGEDEANNHPWTAPSRHIHVPSFATCGVAFKAPVIAAS